MIAKEIYSDSIPALSVNDSAQRALYFMEFFRVSRIPIINDDIFIGMLEEENIIDIEKESSLISECKISLEHAFVGEYQHIYDVVSLVVQYKLSLVAVVDADNNYLGAITPLDLLSSTKEITSIDQSGSILVLEIGIRDYVLSEIAQIAESNHIKILSSYIKTCTDQLNLKLTLKLNTNKLTGFKKTLERYSYKIVAVFSESEMTDELENNRLDEFLHYLNI